MTEFRDSIVVRIVAFLTDIGLVVRSGSVSDGAVLPGIGVVDGALIIDETRLRYPGDLLHEAGHLAVATSERRRTMHDNVGDDAAEEMMAIAWSYAAALHLAIDPAIVFHKDGYRGGASDLLENFGAGRYFGVPMLQWVGMTYDAARAGAEGAEPYPKMRLWLRPA